MRAVSDTSSVALILAQGVAAAPAYLYAALGEAVGQRSGVFNLGVEGVMLMGAFTAFYTVYSGHSPLLGVILAALVGALMGLLLAVVSVTLRAEQGISGIGLYMVGLGLSTLLFNALVQTPRPVADGFGRVPIPLLADLPIIGGILVQPEFAGVRRAAARADLVVRAQQDDARPQYSRRRPESAGRRRDGHQRDAGALSGRDVRRIDGRDRGCIVIYRANQYLSAEHDQRDRVYRGSARLFWRMVAVGYSGRDAFVQHCDDASIVGANARHSGIAQFGKYAPERRHDCGAGADRLFLPRADSGGVGTSVSARRELNARI